MFNKISNKVAAIIVALLVVSFSVFTWISYNNTKNSLIEQSKLAKDAVAKSGNIFTQEFLSGSVAAVMKISKMIEKNPYLASDKEELKQALVSSSLTSDLDALYVATQDNGATYNVIFPKDANENNYMKVIDKEHDDYDARTRPWYIEATKHNGLLYNLPYKSVRSGGVFVLSLAKKVESNGKLLGVVGSEVKVDEILEKTMLMNDTPSSFIVVVDRKTGQFVIHPKKEYIGNKDAKIIGLGKEIVSKHDEYNAKAFEYDAAGDHRVASCEDFKEAGWVVCSANSMSDYDDILNAVLVKQIVTSIVFTALIVLFLVAGVNYFLKPLAFISDGLKSFFSFLNYEIKKPISINVNTKDEFGVMGNLINENIKKIQNTAAQDAKAVNQAVSTAKMIEDGNLKARITDDPANPQLVELKNVLNKMLDTLELKVGSDLNVIKATFDSFRRQDFTSSVPNAKGEVEVVTNALGVEIAKMLQTNLDQAEILQQ
ncbi:MAG: PDC sensor domain-containing protein, partial [Campylobacter sp.]